MRRVSTAGWVGAVLVISASVAHGQSAGEASVRLSGVPVIEVTAAADESAAARAARIADMVLECRFWTDSRRADLLATTSVVRRRVVEAFSDAGLPLPEPDLRRVELQSGRSALEREGAHP